jgi:hypothetical protein
LEVRGRTEPVEVLVMPAAMAMAASGPESNADGD